MTNTALDKSTASFLPVLSWTACIKPGYIYKIDYPIHHVTDPGIVYYGTYRIFPQVFELGRFDTFDDAVKKCQEDAVNPAMPTHFHDHSHLPPHEHPHDHPHDHPH